MNRDGYEILETESGVTIIRYLGNEEILEIPDNFGGLAVNVIHDESFAYNYKIKEVIIPGSVKSIRKWAFSNQVFRKITLNEGLEYIGELAFIQCDFDEIILPKSLLTIDDSAFLKCRRLRKVSILNENVTMAKNAFKDCYNLEEIDFCAWRYLDLKQLTNIVTKKFNCWSTLSDEEQKQILFFIKKKRTLGKKLFLSGKIEIITALISINIKIDLDTLNQYLKHYIKEQKVEIVAVFLDYRNENFTFDEVAKNSENKELIEIGLKLPTLKQFKAKWNCGNVEGGLRVSGYKGSNIIEVIPEMLDCGTKIVALNTSNVANFNPIRKLTIEAKITEIPKKVFAFSSTIEEIYLPDTVTSIGSMAFQNCLKLESFIIPPKVTIIEAETFGNCEELKTVEFHDGVTQINEVAFLKCGKLSNINIPKSVTTIKGHAFGNCFKLFDENRFIIFNGILCSYDGEDDVITIPDSVKIIGKYAFYYIWCKELIIPDSVELIEHQAFSYCNDLDKVTLSPNTVVEKNAFYSCKYKHK